VEEAEMTQVKRFIILVAAMVMLLAAAVPAFAADGQSARNVEGTFRLDISGPLPKGQTFYVRQRGIDTDPTAPICTTTNNMGPLAQACVRGENDLPFVAPKGADIRYTIYRYDPKTGQKQVLARGEEIMRRNIVLGAGYTAY
jgi:hypothetical protein